MKKTLLVLIFIAFSACQAFALSLSTDYWSLTHYNSDVEILLEATGKSQSEFGLYFVKNNDISNPVVMADRLKIFNTGDGAGVQRSLKYQASTGRYAVENADGSLFTGPVSGGSVFGFYFISDGAQYADIAGKVFYSDASLNWNQQDRILTDHSTVTGVFGGTSEKLVIYIEDEEKPISDMTSAEIATHIDNMGIGSKQFDMKIGMDDIAPVPEPGTLLLLGSGLMGLAYLKRRKS